jgi:hypothetical protein
MSSSFEPKTLVFEEKKAHHTRNTIQVEHGCLGYGPDGLQQSLIGIRTFFSLKEFYSKESTGRTESTAGCDPRAG